MKINEILAEAPQAPKTSQPPVGSAVAPKKDPYAQKSIGSPNVQKSIGSPKKGNDAIDMEPVKSDQEFDPEMYKDTMDAVGKKVTSNTLATKPAKVKGIQPGKMPTDATMDNRK
jgi:hypothetical protein